MLEKYNIFGINDTGMVNIGSINEAEEKKRLLANDEMI
jgi:hypothetical protein